MPFDDKTGIDRLDDALDRIVDDHVDIQLITPGATDLIQTHRRMRALDRTPGPDPDFVQRLMGDLMYATTQSLNGNGNGPPAIQFPIAPMRPMKFGLEVNRERRWGFAQLAAAVLLLVLAGGFVAYRLGWFGPDNDRRASISAPIVSPEATPDVTSEGGPVEFLWQTRGDPSDPIVHATRLAIAPDGNIWVPDGKNGRFHIFAADGSLLEIWGSPGTDEGQFNFGTEGFHSSGQGAIAFDQAGNFYVVDTGNFRVQKFGPDREFLIAWGSEGTASGQFLVPMDVAVDGQGRVYVVDANRGNDLTGPVIGAVQVFDENGNFISDWGLRGSEPGQLLGPMGIGIDLDGNILVAEADNNRVQRFSPDGVFLNGLGGYGIANGKFIYANDIAIDAQGRVYATDWGNSRVQVFDHEGRFLVAWGRAGEDDGQFYGPSSIAVDGDGHIYVTDEAGRLQKFRLMPPAEPETTPDAGPVEFLWQTRGDPGSPMLHATNLAIAPDGNIWVPDTKHNRFQIVAPDGSLLEIWGGSGSGEGQFNFLTEGFGGFGQGAIAFDAAGNFYVLDTGNFRIQKFGPDRAFLTSWGSEGTADGQFIGPTDLAIDGQGSVYVVDAVRANDLTGPVLGSVQVFDENGQFVSSWVLRGNPITWAGGLGIGIDLDGNILVAAAEYNRVQRFTPDGALLNEFGKYGIRDGEFIYATDVVSDTQGRVYVSDWGNSRIQVFDHEGRFLATWGKHGLDDGEFDGPVCIALDGNGNIYITDDSGRLQKFRLLPLPDPEVTSTS